jgi:hypothetical protein
VGTAGTSFTAVLSMGVARDATGLAGWVMKYEGLFCGNPGLRCLEIREFKLRKGCRKSASAIVARNFRTLLRLANQLTGESSWISLDPA